MSPRQLISRRDSLARWGARAEVVARTTRHEFAYRWTAPRSAVSRALLVPLFIGIAILVALLSLIALVLVIVVAAAAVIALALSGIVRPVTRRKRRSA